MLLMLELQEAFDELGWEAGAEYEICTAGCQTYEIDGHGTKWSPKKGTKKCNKDAFIVIKNRTRSPYEPSQPNPDLKAHHAT